jgi:hypothetical protein
MNRLFLIFCVQLAFGKNNILTFHSNTNFELTEICEKNEFLLVNV